MDYRQCDRCGAYLTAVEEMGRVCTECLDKGVRRTLAAYHKATRRVLRQAKPRRFKREGKRAR